MFLILVRKLNWIRYTEEDCIKLDLVCFDDELFVGFHFGAFINVNKAKDSRKKY